MANHDKAAILKELIKEIHAGADPAMVKEKFKETLKDTSPTDIGQAEEQLVKEGMPREEVRRLCDVHLEVMRESLQHQRTDVPPGHPIHTFKEEHERITQFLDKLQDVVKELQAGQDPGRVEEQIPMLRHLAEHLMEIEKHNVREENVLFPYLEKYGITEPPAVMWAEHNDLREIKKKLLEVIENYQPGGRAGFLRQLDAITQRIAQTLSSHIFKENNILYPMALQAVKPEEWPEIRRQCDELGYCCFTPETAPAAAEGNDPAPSPGEEKASPVAPPAGALAEAGKGRLDFPSGSLSGEEIQAILNTLPVDITFVDKDDTFRYFNETTERIFVRTRASIGRKVQQCHPQKSLHMVNQILDDFRQGRRDSAHFWLPVEDKLAYISYYAVRNEKGEYLGSLETILDLKPLQEIKGQKRLLE